MRVVQYLADATQAAEEKFAPECVHSREHGQERPPAGFEQIPRYRSRGMTSVSQRLKRARRYLNQIWQRRHTWWQALNPAPPPKHGRRFSSDEDGDGPSSLIEADFFGQNVRGLANSALRKALLTELTCFKAVGLVETHALPSEENTWARDWKGDRAYWSSNTDGTRSRGVALLVSQTDRWT